MTDATNKPLAVGLDREAVARVIDPDGWAKRDGQYRDIMGSTMHDKDRPLAFANADYYTRDSRAKADAIIALAAPAVSIHGISLRGQQGEPPGMMTVTAHLSDGREVVLIEDNGNVISHWKNVRALPAAPTGETGA